MTESKKGYATAIKRLYCSICNKHIKYCDKCKIIFDEFKDVHCENGKKHLCNDCKKEAWKRLYINKLIKGGLSKKEAEENYDAGIDSFDFDDSPEDAARDELSYYMADR